MSHLKNAAEISRDQEMISEIIRDGTERIEREMQGGSSIAVSVDHDGGKEIHVSVLARDHGRTIVAHAEDYDLERAIFKAGRKVVKRLSKERHRNIKLLKKYRLKFWKESRSAA